MEKDINAGVSTPERPRFWCCFWCCFCVEHYIDSPIKNVMGARPQYKESYRRNNMGLHADPGVAPMTSAIG
jgi:hypothetical protein